MNRTSLIREYYARIDRADIDWVTSLFAAEAVYERADAVYKGHAEIDRFFRHDRLIRGTHHVESVFSDSRCDHVVAVGHFSGVGAAGDRREVGYADIWKFGATGLVDRRQTFLALGNLYVRQ